MSVGEQNQLQLVRINDFRNLLMHKASIIKNQAVSWEPQAVNDDVTSLAQTKIAKNILDTYTSHKDYDHKFNNLVQYAVDFGEAFALQTWDAFAGKETQRLPTGETNEDGTPKILKVHEGDTDLRIYQPTNVIRDVAITNHDQNKWLIFRDRVNKWDLAARHPQLYDNIVTRNLEIDPMEYYAMMLQYQEYSDDLVTLYTFVHKKTAALPEGRIIQYLSEDCILSASNMNYDEVPYHRMVDSAIPESNFSYTDSFDMLMVHDLVDGLWSTIISNQRAFGIQNIIIPKGAGISESDLMGNINLISYDPQSGGKPEALELLKTPPEIFKTLEMLQSMKNTIVGVNAVAQGNPPPGVDSGVALNLMQGLNQQYAQGLQESYIRVLSSVGTGLISILKNNAKEERLIEYTGSASRSLLQKFKGSDVNSVARVIAKPGNPSSQTIAGRTAIAEMMLQAGLISTQKDLLEVMDTGSLDVMTDGAENQLLLALQENEELRDGQQVQVHPFDDHVAHIKQHVSIISDISIRRGTPKQDTQTGATGIAPESNPQGQKVLTATQNHIMDHMKQLQNPAVQPVLEALGYGQNAPPPGGPPGVHPAPKENTNVHVHAPGQPPKPGQTPSAAGKPQAAGPKPPSVKTPTGSIPISQIQAAQIASTPTGGTIT